MNTESKKKSFLLFIGRFLTLLNKDQTNIQHRLLVFLFFLCISGFIWLLRTFNETYTVQIKYPVKYTNIPQGKVLIKQPPDFLTLKIKANGYTILRAKLVPQKAKRALKFDVNSFALKNSPNDSKTVYVLTQSATQQLSDELKSNRRKLEIISILPDTIYFQFTNQVNKYISIEPDIKFKHNLIAKQYIINGKINITPRHILVSGPASIIDTLKTIKTQEIAYKELTDTVERYFQLKKIDLLTYSHKRVFLQIPVDRYTQASLNIPIIKRNLPDSLTMKTFPNSVRINYLVAISNYKKVKQEIFKPFIDYNSIQPDVNKLTVQMDSLPAFIHSAQFSPKRVEYLIEKK